MAFFVQICLGVRFLYEKNVLHRDLKPENIFLTAGNRVKIGDFGISKTLETTHQKASTIIGTPQYLSPEVCEGLEYDYQSDMWSLGCILYELAALKSPFHSKSSSFGGFCHF
jgi:NIMA (never in mitosis gene a)-related kinase